MRHSMNPQRSGQAPPSGARWSAIIPVKRPVRAKTRLLPDTVSPDARAELVLAFATDTVRAVIRCPMIHDVLVVTADEEVAHRCAALGARIVDEPASTGPSGQDRLNAAVRSAERMTTAPVCALTADLPALRAEELAEVLARATEHHRSFLADHHGTGTALLAASGGPLEPAFGVDSAQRHAASGAVPLDLTAASVRLDIDEPTDLVRALELGVGPATHDAVRRLRDRGAPELPDETPWMP